MHTLLTRSNHRSQSANNESEGGYLASASDLMIGLLFVFIILVVVLSLEQQQSTRTAQESEKKAIALANEKDALAREMASLAIKNKVSVPVAPKIVIKPVTPKQKIINSEQNDPRGLVTESIGRKIRELVPTIEVHPATGVITLPETMLFASGSSELSQKGIEAVTQLAAQLEKILPCYVAKPHVACDENPQKSEIDTIFVEGHTDSRPLIKENYDNTNLSFDRARSVYKLLALRRDNINLLQFKNQNEQPLFSISGYADTRPVPGEDGLADKNRRVDLRIVLAYKKSTQNNKNENDTLIIQNSIR
jgi:chemotaxis protein MotB